jgi:hypothetical protein
MDRSTYSRTRRSRATTISRKKRVAEMTAEEALERVELRREANREYMQRLRAKARKAFTRREGGENK